MKQECLGELMLVGKIVKVSICMWVIGMSVSDKDGGKIIVNWKVPSEKRRKVKRR